MATKAKTETKRPTSAAKATVTPKAPKKLAAKRTSIDTIAKLATAAQATQPALDVKADPPKPVPVPKQAPAIVTEAPRPTAAPSTTEKPAKGKSYQINFRASEKVMRLIDKLSREYGSTRALIGHLLKNAGHDVDEADLGVNPFGPRRREL